jgi:hypothetical protein
MMREPIGIVYLYRCSEGPGPVVRFLRSYQTYRGATPHDFHVIFKGFPNSASLASARALFGELPVHAIELDDSGYDIGSYLAVARRATNDRLVFLNTFSHLIADDWLDCLDRASRPERVGIAGSTGSWTSHSSNYDQAVRRFLNRIRQHPQQQKVNSNDTGSSTEARSSLLVSLRKITRLPQYIHAQVHYQKFPNPHVRTNAFVVRRALFLGFKFPSFRRKTHAYSFESGRSSMTRQSGQQGLDTLIVGRGGVTFSPREWNLSKIFWQSEQENLLIADNQTDDYAHGSTQHRQYLNAIAWGGGA